MAAVGNILLADATDPTPVTRTFEPSYQIQGGFVYENRAGGVQIGNDKLTLQIRRPVGPGGVLRNNKAIIRLETPVLKTVSSGGDSLGYTAAPEVGYRPMFEVVFTLPVQCSELERKHLHTLLINFVNNNAMHNLVDKLDAPY